MNDIYEEMVNNFSFGNTSTVGKQIYTVHMVYMNPRYCFLHYHVVQLERNFCSLPPLISLSTFKVQVLWVCVGFVWRGFV